MSKKHRRDACNCEPVSDGVPGCIVTRDYNGYPQRFIFETADDMKVNKFGDLFLRDEDGLCVAVFVKGEWSFVESGVARENFGIQGRSASHVILDEILA